MNYLPCLVCLEWCLNVSQSNVLQPTFQTHALCLLLRLCKIWVKSSLHYNTIEHNINKRKQIFVCKKIIFFYSQKSSEADKSMTLTKVIFFLHSFKHLFDADQFCFNGVQFTIRHVFQQRMHCLFTHVGQHLQSLQMCISYSKMKKTTDKL